MLYEPVTHLTLPRTVPEVQKRCGLCCRLLLFLYFFLTTGFLSVGIYFCHYTVELPLQWYFTEQLLAKARNWKSTQNLQCTGDAATVNHKNDYLNFSAFCFINVYKDRNQTGLNLGICKAIFQQLRSEWVSWYHLISSPSAFRTLWHVFLSTHLCLWVGSNDCTRRRHLGFFWCGTFRKTSDSLAHCSLVILHSAHIVLVSNDISLEPLAWAVSRHCSCYREQKAEPQNHRTEPQ